MKIQIRHIALLLLMLLLGGMVNETWAAGYKVTYHILTLPINTSRYDYHMNAAFDGKRLEAFRYVENNATTIKLPDTYKSPLAKNFKYYYDGDNIVKTAAAQLYSDNTATKSWSYSIIDETAVVAENTTLTGNCNIYVTYEYDDSKDIKLDGSVKYNITMSGGYMALNRGRNNRLAVIPENLVSSEQLASEDFVYVDVSSVKDITTYWATNNKNKRADVESQFLFLFKYEGKDPYNIVIASAYDKNTTYIEKHNDRESQLYKWYKDSHLFGKNTTSDNLFLASDDHKKYLTAYDANLSSNPTEIESVSKPGYFHTMWDNVIWNSYALLNSTTTGGYVYMVTRTVNGSGDISAPSDNKYTFLRHEKNNNVRFGTMTLGSASTSYSSDEDMYDIRTYSFKVKTPFNNTISVDKEWSDASLSQSIMEHFPDELRRKYVTIEGLYSDQAFTDPVTTFADAKSRCTPDGAGKYSIYVKYSVQESLPFTAIAAANKTSGYSTATWYELTDAGSVQADGKKIRWDNTNTVFKNNGESGTYEKESEFAFIGDPYELRIICRKQTTENSANYYVGCADPSSSENLGVNSSDESAHYKWEIPYDDTSGSFTLREMNSSNACWYWDASSAGNSLTYSTTASTRIKPMTIGKLNYTFKVVDLAGNIAIQATAEASPFTPLTGAGVGYSMIPASIRSPYIADETITFYSSYTDRNEDGVTDRRDWHYNYSGGIYTLSEQPTMTELPGTNNSDIYVAYTTSRLSNKSITLGQTQSFNVNLNGEYIYWNSSTGKVMSDASPADLTANAYLWRLRGRDPYAMIIDNIGATANAYNGSFTDEETVTIYADNGTTTTESRYKGSWVKTSDGTWDNDKSLAFDTDRTHAARFIAMLGNYAGVYEVMAATGNDTYYHIGRVSEENAEVKIYSTSTYPHGADQLRFVLESTTLIQYHLIDKSGKEIFRNEIESKNARLTLPADYVSPLVASYHYYAASDVTRANGADGNPGTEDDIFTLKANPTDLSEAGENTEIYVFYDVSNEIGFGDRHPHMLKFWNGKSYKLEDGNDNLTTGAKIKAMYPYCNGDGSLNVYGEAMNEEQMAGGSSTRPRWVWFFESDNNDPYHVKIHSKSTISFGGRSNTTYLQTFAVHFNQDTDAPNKQRIVTGGNLIGVTQDKATEYAILGIKNKYKLLTIDPVAADLNGNGNKTDDGENERIYVTSFEQYWKTYNMIKKCVLGINVNDKDEPYHNDFSDDRSTFEMPSELWPTLKTKLGSGTGNFDINDPNDLNYVDDCSWHSYDAVAYAVRWNGYNDKSGSDGLEKKKVERLEHWFQTFDMGDGTFDIEDADIPPVLVLLDRHGWEIMRKPIPMGDGDADPSAGEKLAALRAYDSPMVKEYTFYSNATKGTGCHKYAIRMQGGKERDTIAVNNIRFTSTSLATLPPYKVDRDLFVTYTVKEEYEKSYTYNFTSNSSEKTFTESGTPSAFLILQNATLAKDDNSDSDQTDIDTTPPGKAISEYIKDNVSNFNVENGSKKNELWYLQPNLHIDKEMGIRWATEEKASLEPHTEYETKDEYKNKTGFDPYNLQIQNVESGKYFTTHITNTSLSEGAMVGNYSGGGSYNVTLESWVDVHDRPAIEPNGNEGYDHTYIQMTNQTFMAVQDANGNMQLMPRFDHSRRINAFVSLANPQTHETEADIDDVSPGVQTTFFVRPQVFDYRILDNDGNVAMHYQTAGESYPSIPEHFKSPLAKNFKYYFGHAAYKTAASTADAWNGATGIFQKTATNEADMNNQARVLTATGDYFFKIGSSTYTYTKVTVTNVNTTTTSDGIYNDVSTKKDIAELSEFSQFAAAGIQNNADIFIRYSYDEASDIDYDNILRGRWMTMSLGGNNAQYSGTLNQAGSGIYKDSETPTKPATINSDTGALKWQWKFLQSPCVSTSSYYVAPDPYSVKISNRDANKAEADMGTAIKVGNIDRFVILNHPSGDYALAAAGDGLTYSFLNGGSMTAPSTTPASIVGEGGFTTTSNTISDDARLIFTNDVTHTFTYNIITNEKLLAAHATQDNEAANVNGYNPVVPEGIQSQLIYLDDYLYYGTAPLADEKYNIDINSQIDNLYGLYDDVVYVRYPAFSRDNTPYLVPNARNDASPVAVGSGSNDVAIDISGNLPYDIIWLDDNMMRSSNGTDIIDGGDNGGNHTLSANSEDMWHFEGDDPYAIKIKRAGTNPAKYVDGTNTLNETPKTFMLLKRDGYDYGVFAETGNQGTMLTFGNHDSNDATPYTLFTTTGAPTKFIPFALSVYNLIYHLVIAKTCADRTNPQNGEFVDIAYREGTEISPNETLKTERIYGSTQRDLTNYPFADVDAGKVSLGDELEVPNAFYRPNCDYLYYVEGIYDSYTDAETNTPNVDLNNKYKGLWLNDKSLGLEVPKLMSDADLIGKTVKINVAYGFLSGLATNAGDGFVTSTTQNLWYTFETNDATPYLAHYTNAWGLQSMRGRATRYTNDYLWTPLGDPYGFKMYNRYMCKNSEKPAYVMTTPSVTDGKRLLMAEPGVTDLPASEGVGKIPTGVEVYELLADETTTPGYFRIHPVVNTEMNLFIIRGTDDYAELSNTATPTEWRFGLSLDLIMPYIDRIGYVGGLKSEVANSTAFVITGEPGTVNVKDLISAIKNGTADAVQLMKAQKIVYNTDNIVGFESGYYRLHNQPGVSGINPIRYASGYLHDIEKTAGESSTAIPMHFYSKTSVSTTFEGDESSNLNNGFTKTAATQGAIPVPAAEYDPSTIFYINGSISGNPTISTATMSTQELYVASNAMGDTNEGTTANRLQRAVMSATPGDAISFKLMDIGGAVFLIHDGADPSVRRYLNFDQSNFFQRTATDDADMNAHALKLTSKGTYYFKIGESTYKKLTVATGYVASPETNATLDGEAESSNAEEWAGAADKYDLKYYHDSPTDDAKWCLEPANNQGLMLATNDGGDGYFYATFCAPYDVQLPAKVGSTEYLAYICTAWNSQAIHPTKVPASGDYLEGKFVPAGTPVIIRTTDNTGKMKLTLPKNSPTDALTCVFTGKYLEQLLATEITAEDKIYAFGLPITGYNITTDSGASNGEITDLINRDQAKKGVGFYVNATPNKELGANNGAWTPNNRYVLHNKIYYRSSESSGASAPQMDNAPDFVPVIFGDEEPGEEELQPDGTREVIGDGCIYDLLGRKVATREQVEDGTWRERLAPGIYILNGKKFKK